MEGILSVLNPGESVLDPFCGSGSTGRAAAALGLRFVGVEMGDEIVGIARDRVAAAAKSAHPLFVDSGQS